MSFSDVTPGTPIIASNVQQVIDALSGTAGKGVPLTVSAVNDSARYALTLENTEATNSRALNVLKSDSSVLIRADATGVTLGAPLNLPTGSVTSTAILDGTIATADLANNAVTNAKLGTDTARLNLLTNGGFEIWQRGAGPFTAQAAYSADRWALSLAGGDTLSVSRDTTNTDNSKACAACTFTLSTGAGSSALYQVLPATDGWALSGKTVSVSVRVRTATASAVAVSIGNQAAFQATSTLHPGGGVYQTLTVSYVVQASDTSVTVSLRFYASCTAYLDNAMLVVGSVPADYAPLHPADDLARCKRYFEIVGGDQANDLYFTSYAGAGAQGLGFPVVLVEKPVVPTVTRFGSFTVTNAGQPTFTGVGKRSFSLTATSSAAGLVVVSNATAGIGFSVEANP